MANRVSVDELKEIIETERDESILEAFILAANLTVTEHLGSNSNVSAAQLKEIERWLAAHFLASTLEPQPASEGADRANITYQGVTEKGLNYTSYGQAVQVLDPTGVLAAVVGKKKASVYAITSFE